MHTQLYLVTTPGETHRRDLGKILCGFFGGKFDEAGIYCGIPCGRIGTNILSSETHLDPDSLCSSSSSGDK